MSDTGLRQPHIMGVVLDRVMQIEAQWLSSSADPRQRMQMLVDCVFSGLDAIGMPHPDVQYDPNLGETLSGLYDPNSWTLQLNSNFATRQVVERDGEAALRECFDTVYHETRHHEQFFRSYYYLLMTDSEKDRLRNNFPIYTGQGMTPAQAVGRSFGLPPKWAEAFWDKIRKRDRYAGKEQEEAKDWYDETFGRHKAERSKVMQDLNTFGTRSSKYSLYRTLTLEDDGWETGYLVGDLYMRRSLLSKKGKFVEKARLLATQKEKLASAPLQLRDWVSKARSEGASDQELRTKIQQVKTAMARMEHNIRATENEVNIDKQRLRDMGDKSQNLVRRHRESMSQHRIKANEKRRRCGRVNYLGTASPSGAK